MKYSIKHALAAVFAAASALPATALAGAGQLTTTVTPLSPAVTYSAPATATRAALDTYVGYRVLIANSGGNTINRIVFRGRISATDKQERAVFSSADGATCKTDEDGDEVRCALGQLKAGQAFAEFVLFFKAPAKDPASPLPDGDSANCAQTDCLSFRGQVVYAEGHGDDHKSKPRNSSSAWAAAPVTLGTFNPSLVKTAVQRTGGTVFTGSGAVPTTDDRFTTAVAVPASPTYTTAQIQEELESQFCSNNFSDCYRTDVTVPGVFSPYLTIVLRQDKSTILKGAKIEGVLVKYFADDGSFHFVGDCASPTTPRSDGLPCVARRTHYSTSSVPGWTPELDGDFEWTLINLKNGSYKVF